MRAAIAAMSPQDRVIAERLHEIIKASAPDLSPKTWYGMPAYAKDGKVVCFFRNAGKFKERYAMFGFNDSAKLDEGSMWPVAFARILASSAAVNFASAKATGHMEPSSSIAVSLKPSIAYRSLNFPALRKKQTTLPSLAYAGIPYQVSARVPGRWL